MCKITSRGEGEDEEGLVTPISVVVRRHKQRPRELIRGQAKKKDYKQDNMSIEHNSPKCGRGWAGINKDEEKERVRSIPPPPSRHR